MRLCDRARQDDQAAMPCIPEGSPRDREDRDAAGTATLTAQSSSTNLAMPATDFDLAELHGSAAAVTRSMRGDFDPRRFLEALSSQLGRLIPHDRLTLVYLEESGRTFSVFGEHTSAKQANGDPLRHEGHYTIRCDPGSRYTSEQIGHA